MVTSQETTPRQERREKVEKRVRFVLPDRTRPRKPGQQSGDDYRESRYSSHGEERERPSRWYFRNHSRESRRTRSQSPRYDGPRRYHRGSHRRFDSPDYGRERSHGRDQRQPRRHDSNRSRESREDRTRTRDRGEPANQQGSAPGAPETTDDGSRGHNACLFPVHSISSVVDEIQRTVPGPQVDMVWGPRPIIRAMYEEFKAKNGLCTAHILPSRNDDEGDGNAY